MTSSFLLNLLHTTFLLWGGHDGDEFTQAVSVGHGLQPELGGGAE